MPRYKYLGADGVRVGRFGVLSHGQEVELHHSEAAYIKERGMVDWQDVTDEDATGIGTLLPVKNRWYDLTRIVWNHGTLHDLRHRGKSDLDAIGMAMRELGAQIPDEKSFRSHDASVMAEIIYTEACRLQWEKPENKAIDRNVKPEPTIPILSPPSGTVSEGEAEEPALEEPVLPPPPKPVRTVTEKPLRQVRR